MKFPNPHNALRYILLSLIADAVHDYVLAGFDNEHPRPKTMLDRVEPLWSRLQAMTLVFVERDFPYIQKL